MRTQGFTVVSLVVLVTMVLTACSPQSQAAVQTAAPVVQTVVVGGTPQTIVVTSTPAATQAATFKSKDPSTFTVETFGEPETLDPALDYETAGGEIIQNTYDFLVFYNKDKVNELVPMLATEVPSQQNGGISADGTTYTFKIRQGVKFHNGDDMKPSDVAYTFQRGILQGGTASPQWLLAEPFFGTGVDDVAVVVADKAKLTTDLHDDTAAMQKVDPAVLKAVCEQVKSVVVPDDTAGTVTMTLAQSWGPFLATIANTWGSVMSQKWVTANKGWDGSCDTWQNFYAPGQEGTKLGKVIMGTGPYKLDHWTPDVEWVLTAKDDYWRQAGDELWPGGPSGAPQIKRIVHKTVTEWGTRFAMLQTGDAAWVEVPMANRPQVDAWVGESCDSETDQCTPTDNSDQPLRVWPKLTYPGRTDFFPSFDVKTGETGENPYIGSGKLDGNGIPPDFFSDVHMRKALSYCFDYDTYIEEGQNGDGVRNSSVIITNMLGYNPDQEMYPFDMDKCKEELELAWDGKVAEVGFRFQAITSTGSPMPQTALAILQSNLRSIDPKYQMEIVTLPWASYLAAFRAGLLPIAVSGWQEDYHDPHNWVQPFLVGTYATRQSFPEEFKDIFRPLIEQAVVEPDETKRAELYYELGKLRYEQVPEVNLSQDGERIYTQRWVNGFFWNPVLGYRYFYAYDLGGGQ